MNNNIKTNTVPAEKVIKAKGGMGILVLNTILMLASVAGLVFGIINIENGSMPLGVALTVICGLYLFFIGWLLYIGLRVVKPGEAAVLTLFGKYMGTIKEPGFYFVNPFATNVPPPASAGVRLQASAEQVKAAKGGDAAAQINIRPRRISLKTMTLNNEKQKINDQMGNPIIIGIVVIWKVADTAKALFAVDDYTDFLSTQCDSALRNIVRMYPYDVATGEDSNEKSLRGSSQEISEKLRDEIQEKVSVAGLEIDEARITHLAYAPEIAAAMLQRQQAAAVVDARQLIVEGAVGMVEMALESLNQKGVVELDEERKAAMVSNLLVVLCGNKDAQPIVNSGSIY